MSWQAIPKRGIAEPREPQATLSKPGPTCNKAVRLSFNTACRKFLQPGPVVLCQDGTKLAIRAATTDDDALFIRVLSTQYQVSASQIGEVGGRFRVHPPSKDGIIVLEPIEEEG